LTPLQLSSFLRKSRADTGPASASGSAPKAGADPTRSTTSSPALGVLDEIKENENEEGEGGKESEDASTPELFTKVLGASTSCPVHAAARKRAMNITNDMAHARERGRGNERGLLDSLDKRREFKVTVRTKDGEVNARVAAQGAGVALAHKMAKGNLVTDEEAGGDPAADVQKKLAPVEKGSGSGASNRFTLPVREGGFKRLLHRRVSSQNLKGSARDSAKAKKSEFKVTAPQRRSTTTPLFRSQALWMFSVLVLAP
jgi:hypothetical protein